MKEHTKSRTNVSIDRDLLQEARARGINLSALVEAAIRDRLREEASARWLDENRESIEGYNRQVQERGVFSDGLRSF